MDFLGALEASVETRCGSFALSRVRVVGNSTEDQEQILTEPPETRVNMHALLRLDHDIPSEG